jgi:hypothetical protein
MAPEGADNVAMFVKYSTQENYNVLYNIEVYLIDEITSI